MSFRHITTASVLAVLLVAPAHAASLGEEIEEIHRVDREHAAQRDPGRANALRARSARLKQRAIARAIAEYRIATDRVPTGVNYTPHGGMREREGVTLVDRDGTVRVQIGDAAFRSAAVLGSTIAHEVEVHVDRQIAKGERDAAADEQGVSFHEVEAYDHELASRARFGLTDDEAKQLRQRRAAWYRRLHYENRKRVDEGRYVKW